MAGTSNDTEERLNWIEFCDRHARVAASDFARAFCTYVSSNLPENARSTVSHRDFVRKFVDCFVEHFEAEFLRKNSIHGKEKLVNGNMSMSASASSALRSGSHDELSDYSEHETDSPSPKTQHKPFFRRLSFKGLRRGKAFFHKQHSDEVELSHGHAANKNDKHSSKTRLSKIVVECRKEGIVNYLLGENLDGTHGNQKWEKCRLALVKTVGGYMLEFYSPPKAENNMEYVIEAHDCDDMRSWLATIKYCMRSSAATVRSEAAEARSTSSTDGQDVRIRMERKPEGSTAAGATGGAEAPGTSSPAGSLGADNPPELPPRLPGGRGVEQQSMRLSSTSNFELCSSQQELEQLGEGAVGGDPDASLILREYPWFHGTLARSEAAQLVLHAGTGGHVQTVHLIFCFSLQHLRMTLTTEGQCRVQHLWFPTIFDMLDHFRQHPIPLESGGASDVTLNDFVVAARGIAGSGSSGAGPSGSGADRSRPPIPPEPREVVTHAGSVRTRTESMERLDRAAAAAAAGNNAAALGRAVENTYSFV
ncbi:hypothetical protein B566_EDAN009955 [Ephemera danica]|nr:hypothetical protein B566_EDAN009955 [Ephemera danica]